MRSIGWNQKRVRSWLVLCLAAACAPEPGSDPAAGLPVVAVPVEPLAGLVEHLLPGGAAQIVVLVPPGANPATHEPSVSELRRASAARLYLEVGHPSFVFERAWLSSLLEGSAAERVRLFGGCEAIEGDPHVWISAPCLRTGAGVLAEELTKAFPAAAVTVGGNLDRFLARLDSLESAAADRLGPHAGKSFIVLHAAWGYLARDHDLRQVEILSHGTGDPGPARVARIVREGREEGVRTVFVQPQFNPEPADLLARELGASVILLDPLRRDPIEAIAVAAEALAEALEARGS